MVPETKRAVPDNMNLNIMVKILDKDWSLLQLKMVERRYRATPATPTAILRIKAELDIRVLKYV
jgi:hypothetical protein